jgi:diacylglycerol kinase (ATP)
VQQILRATVNSFNGLLAAMRSEAAFRQELVALALAVPLAFFIGKDGWTRLLMIAAVLLVLIVELLNSAIEKLADRVTPAPDPLIKRVKDMASAAVGVTIVVAGLVWLYAVGERLIQG